MSWWLKGAVQVRGLPPAAHAQQAMRMEEDGVDEAPRADVIWASRHSITIDICWPTVHGWR